jgi:hypothetical protein
VAEVRPDSVYGVQWTNRKTGAGSECFLPGAALELAWRPGTSDEKHRAYTPAEMADLEPPCWIVKDFLQEKSFTVIFGQPGTCKTFVALDIALALASGIGSWHGHRCKKAPVLYCLGEGFSGALPRITAWGRGRPVAILEGCWANGFARFMPFTPHLGDDLTVAEFVAYVRTLDPKPEVVFIDTLSRAMAGCDESSAEDISAMIERVDAIRRELGIAVVLIHHEGKDGTKGARGSSALSGGADCMLHIAKADMRVTVTCVKAKDWEPPRPLLLGVDKVEVGPGADGAISSLRVRRLTDAEIQGTLQRTQGLIVEFLGRPENAPGATAKEAYEDLEVSRRTFHDAARKLIDQGIVVRRANKKYVLVKEVGKNAPGEEEVCK